MTEIFIARLTCCSCVASDAASTACSCCVRCCCFSLSGVALAATDRLRAGRPAGFLAWDCGSAAGAAGASMVEQCGLMQSGGWANTGQAKIFFLTVTCWLYDTMLGCGPDPWVRVPDSRFQAQNCSRAPSDGTSPPGPLGSSVSGSPPFKSHNLNSSLHFQRSDTPRCYGICQGARVFVL